jgi:pimeloyl-[acyl-carrier protein] synthase
VLRTFADPNRLGVGRSPNPALAFGAGAHLCLCAPLARMVGQLALAAAPDRFGALALLPGEPSWRPSLVPRGLTRLPVNVA